MTPQARIQAAIEVIDRWLTGEPVDRVLLNWTRSHRFAGSKDRAVIQDIVYNIVRQKLSFAAQAGCHNEDEITARRLALGYLRSQDVPVENVFGAGGYGPLALTPEEMVPSRLGSQIPSFWQIDIPEVFWPIWNKELGENAIVAADEQKLRAPLFLRVNLRRTGIEAVQALLANEGILTERHPDVNTALVVKENPRRVQGSKSYAQGLIEIQDAHSQAVLAQQNHDLIKALEGPVLDACAGGGGKALAAWDLWGREIHAYDANSKRLRDIRERSKRAGAKITVMDKSQLLPAYSTVLCDVPCSGSGAWRRSPQGKWKMSPQYLQELLAQQYQILEEMAGYVSEDGVLIYMTCSILPCENTQQIQVFLNNHEGWSCSHKAHFSISAYGDGLFVACLTRK